MNNNNKITLNVNQYICLLDSAIAYDINNNTKLASLLPLNMTEASALVLKDKEEAVIDLTLDQLREINKCVSSKTSVSYASKHRHSVNMRIRTKIKHLAKKRKTTQR